VFAGDLDRDAGPELDDDGVTGKDGDEGHRGNAGHMDQTEDGPEPPPPGTEINGSSNFVLAHPKSKQADEKNSSMQVEEFEPVYD
jgi:hypothetical protein